MPPFGSSSRARMPCVGTAPTLPTARTTFVDAGAGDDARAIAADRETAAHIDPITGIAQVFATAGAR